MEKVILIGIAVAVGIPLLAVGMTEALLAVIDPKPDKQTEDFECLEIEPHTLATRLNLRPRRYRCGNYGE